MKLLQNNMKIIILLILFLYLPINDVLAFDIPPKTKLTNELSKLEYGKYQKNIKIIKDALAIYGEKDPWACKAYYNLGTEYYRMGNYPEAIKAVDKALQLPETFAGLYVSCLNMKMNCQNFLGLKEDAIKTADLLSKDKSPNSADLRANAIASKASFQEELKQNDQSIKTYEEITTKSKSVNMNKYAKSAYMPLINLYATKKMYDMAINTCDRFLAIYPNDEASSLVAMQREQIRQGKMLGYPLSSLEIIKILNKYSGNTALGQHVIYDLASAYAREGKYSEAISTYKKVFNYKKKESDTMYNPALSVMAAKTIYSIYRDQKNMVAAKDILEKALKKFPKEASQDGLDKILQQLNNKQKKQNLKEVMFPLAIILILSIIGVTLKIKNNGIKK